MPYLILSDIHANREALDAVLEDAQGSYDRVVCLGDLVGYGADPNYAVERTLGRAASAIRGNHDKACVENEPLDTYNPAARAAAAWTRSALTADNLERLRNLPRGPLRVGNGTNAFDEFDLVHGSPGDEDEYMIHAGDVARARECLETRLTFFGHTHVQGGFLLARGGIRRIFPNGVLELEPDHEYLINPGSVGQPRDTDPRAAYAIYAPEDRTIEFRRTRYNVSLAASKILEAGLPPFLAARLFDGT